jgi:hypothetical protein
VVGVGLLTMGLASTAPVGAAAATLPGASGSGYYPQAPQRLLDTRTTTPSETLGANSTSAPLAIPADDFGATAVSLNVTVTNTTDASYLSVFPTGGTKPYVSNLNWTAGETVAQSVIVPVPISGADEGMVSFYNHTGKTDVVVDLEGVFWPSHGDAYVPLSSPQRITDTRAGSGYPNAGATLPPASALNVQVANEGGVPADATAVIMNVTVTNTTASSFLTAYPYDGAGYAAGTEPTSSNLNWTAGETVANRVLVALGNGGETGTQGAVSLYNYAGNADVVVDVAGYFVPWYGYDECEGYCTVPSNASLYTATTPTRITDTRAGSGYPNAGATLGAGGILPVNAETATDGIPAGATAAVLDVTATDTTASSFFTVYAAAPMPIASDVNWIAGGVVPNLTIATLNSSGGFNVFNHAGSADLVVDTFGYFSPINPVVPAMVSAVVTATTIAITYNEAPTCPMAADLSDFAYDYTTGTPGGAATSCAVVHNLLTLTGTFTLPTASGTIVYTAPATSTTSNAVSATSYGQTTFAATQPLTLAPAPAMVAAVVNATSGTIAIEYNEPVTCVTAADAQFAYYSSTGVASGTGWTNCTTDATAPGGDVLTLTGTGIGQPNTGALTGANIVYTAPTNVADAVSAYLAPDDVAATQTLLVSAVTVPAIQSATVNTAGTAIAVTYNEAVNCPTTTTSAGDFAYEYNGTGTPAAVDAAGCSGSGTTILTLTPATGTTFTLPTVVGATLTYTQGAGPQDATSVNASSNSANFEASETLTGVTPAPVPSMVSAVVGATTITITYNEPVSCSATGAELGQFAYDSATTPTVVNGITSIASCAAGIGNTLVLTGVFLAPTGSASIVYTELVPATTSNAVYATGTTTDFAANGSLPGSAIS